MLWNRIWIEKLVGNKPKNTKMRVMNEALPQDELNKIIPLMWKQIDCGKE